jgi:hypothetical protein
LTAQLKRFDRGKIAMKRKVFRWEKAKQIAWEVEEQKLLKLFL